MAVAAQQLLAAVLGGGQGAAQHLDQVAERGFGVALGADAQRALVMGLLNQVVPAERLMDTAYDYAERIAANAPLAVFATKQSAVEGLTLDLESAYDNETRHSDRVFATEDAKEGPRAFAEKRAPRWQAR